MKAFIKIVVDAPAECTMQEFIDWVKFEIGLSGHLNTKNPLCDFTLDNEILEDETEVEIEIIKNPKTTPPCPQKK